MKRLQLLLLSLVSLFLANVTLAQGSIEDAIGFEDENVQDVLEPFVTTWQTTSSNENITIPTGGGADITDFDFTIDWGDGTIETITGDDPDPSHSYAAAGTYTVSIRGTFPWMQQTDAANAVKLQTVVQWGDIQWEKTAEMFFQAENMTYNATDAPNLTQVTNMDGMFFRASSFNGDITNWDVSNVTTMKEMFREALSFNQPIGNWNTTNVTDMAYMFAFNNAFNQDISGWNVSGVTNMEGMFFGASAFNQNINTKVINEGTPEEYTAWDVSHGPSFYAMFLNATSFNQPLDHWDVSQVTDLDYMFAGAAAFNQNIGGWDVSNVNDNFGPFLKGSGLSTENYDALLEGWSQLDLVDGMTMNLDAMYSCAAADARQSIIDNNNWTINDGGSAVDCDFAPFVTTWQTTSSNENITIPTGGGADITDFDFTIDWGDGTIETITGDDPDPSHSYAAAGTYTVSIRGTFPWMQQTDAANAVKLQTVVQWGDIQWEKTAEMFFQAENMTYNATDAPNLTQVTNMGGMFADASSFNGDISNWDVPTIQDFSAMFRGASSFNQDISDWDVSSATNMASMFFEALSFNQPVANWDVSNVTVFDNMFRGPADPDGPQMSFSQDISSWNTISAESMVSMFERNRTFNQNIGNWNVSNVTDFAEMFRDAIAFNQDIGNWNVSSATYMRNMFRDASSFDQDISQWNVSNLEEFGLGRFVMSLSTANYDALLQAWSQLELTNSLSPNFGETTYSCAAADARQSIIDNNNWTINDGGSVIDCDLVPMELVYTIPNDGELVRLYFGTINEFNNAEVTVDIIVDWGDGSQLMEVNNIRDFSKTYATNGTYTVKIYGALSHFGGGEFSPAGAEYLTTVNSFGELGLQDLDYAFYGASALTSVPEALPSTVTSLSYTFYNAFTFNQDLSSWDVSNVTDFSFLFSRDTFDETPNMSFNQPIGNWTMTNATDLGFMFAFNNAFNQDLSGWNVSNVTDMQGLFFGATAFNQDLSGWDVSNVTNFFSMFRGFNDPTMSFNQDISGWTTSSAENMNSMFRGNPVFNQDIGGWDVSNVTDMASMFRNASSFDQDLSQWDITANVNDEFGPFLEGSGLSTENYDALLIGWSQLDLPSDTYLGIGSTTYSCAAADARQSIIDTYGWTIDDGGLADDNEAPTVVTQDITVELDENGEVAITADQINNGSSDSCGVDTLTLDVSSFDCNALGENTVVLTVTDASGNEATGTAIVTVEDNLAPTVLTQDITVQLDANGEASITADQIDNGSSDNCGLESLVLDITDFTSADVGENTVTLTVTDTSGNVSTETA
ncbi:surface protein, partial [Psychroflexus salarius]